MKELLKPKIIGSVIAIIILTFLSTYWFFPRTIHHQSEPIVVVDSEAIQRAIKEYDGIIAEKDGFIARLLHTHSEGVPHIAIGRPSESPLNGRTIHDTIWIAGTAVTEDHKLYGYDFPMSGTISDDEITFTTINPLLEYTGGKYVKEYKFQREAENFRFATQEVGSEIGLQGIRLIFDNKPIAWKGIYVGYAVGYPMTSYGYLKARIEFYSRLALIPEIRTQENFLWLLTEWKVN